MEDLQTNVETSTEEVATEEKNGKFYTEEEIALIEQKAGDKRVSQYQKTMEKKQREADKLRSMSEDDKREYNLSQREQAIAAKEAELAMLENKSEGLAILSDKGLDSKLIDFVISEDAEVMYDNIKKIERLFKASVKAEVEKRLGSGAPLKNVTADDSLTREAFNKMSMQ